MVAILEGRYRTLLQEIAGYVRLAATVLAMLQLSLNQKHAYAMQHGQRKILDTMNDVFEKFMVRLGDIFALVGTCATQGSILMRSTAMLISTNLQVYQKVSDIHKLVTSLPPQLQQDQPVYFVDAYGKETAFYLDFVFSLNVLIDWLMRRFESTGQGKIARGEFVLSDSRTNRELDLCEPWDVLFHPGMHVAMDMVFQDICAPADVNSCPACHGINDNTNGGRITCFKCNLQFYRTSSGALSQPCALQNWHSSHKIVLVDGPNTNEKSHENCKMEHFRRLKLILASDTPNKSISGTESPNAATPLSPQQQPKQPLFPAESIGQVAVLGFMRVEATRYLATLGNPNEWRGKAAQVYLLHFVIGASNFLKDWGMTLGRYEFKDPRYDWDCD